MKFVQALCETITSALGLSAFSPWGENVNGPGDGHYLRPIKGHDTQHTLKAEVRPTPVAKPVKKHDAHHGLHPLFPNKHRNAAHGGDRELSIMNQKLPNGAEDQDKDLPPGPIFAPPNASPEFVCNYTAMRGWRHTAGGTARNQWLEKPIMDSDSTGGIYNIFTNYDQYAPIGTLRQVSRSAQSTISDTCPDAGFSAVSPERHRPKHQRRWYEPARWRQSL